MDRCSVKTLLHAYPAPQTGKFLAAFSFQAALRHGLDDDACAATVDDQLLEEYPG